MLLVVGTEEAGSGQAGARTGAFPARQGGSAEPRCCVNGRDAAKGSSNGRRSAGGGCRAPRPGAALGPLPGRCLHGEVFIPV